MAIAGRRLRKSRNVEEGFERLDRIEEGSYGVVYRARDRTSREIVALKRVKLSKEICADGFPITALREINVLLSLSHPNIVAVNEMVVSDSDEVFMVMEYYDFDLKSILEKADGPFSQADAKSLMIQLGRAVKHMHSHWFMHRDIKSSNCLYARGTLALADFGLARRFGDPPPHDPQYTRNVVTLWYRPPELLLPYGSYRGPEIDIWSMACVFTEILTQRPLFSAKSELELLAQIFQILGPPTAESWPAYASLAPNHFKFAQTSSSLSSSETNLRSRLPPTGLFGHRSTPLPSSGFHLISSLLALDPSRRLSATQVLNHPFFASDLPRPTPPNSMPHFQLDRL